MLNRKKINNDVVAVAWEPTEILLRKSGTEYYDTEEAVVEIRDGHLVINTRVADAFGLKIEMVNT